jgi:hypothetical protein
LTDKWPLTVDPPEDYRWRTRLIAKILLYELELLKSALDQIAPEALEPFEIQLLDLFTAGHNLQSANQNEQRVALLSLMWALSISTLPTVLDSTSTSQRANLITDFLRGIGITDAVFPRTFRRAWERRDLVKLQTFCEKLGPESTQCSIKISSEESNTGKFRTNRQKRPGRHYQPGDAGRPAAGFP